MLSYTALTWTYLNSFIMQWNPKWMYILKRVYEIKVEYIENSFL